MGALAVLGLTGALGALAARVKPDFSVELLFPVHDPSKADYERYKRDFPYEDARAVVIVEAEDLWSPRGLARVAALEADLAAIEGVLYTDGPTTVRDVVARGEDELETERLFPRADLPPEEIARRRETATTDPLFVWTLAPPPPPAGPVLEIGGAAPEGGAATIRVTLRADVARVEEGRARFVGAARAVIARHEEAARAVGVRERLTLTGIPVLRPEYNELINTDTAVLFPLAFVTILALLLVIFRSVAIAAAAAITIAFSVVWTYGAMGLFAIPLQTLTSITPIVVMIISISDTVHTIAHYKSALAAGLEGTEVERRRRAIAAACADTALPCLLTELTIAAGFLTLLGVNIVAIWQFGIATAAGVLLAWLANMLVLPLALDLLRPRAVPEAAETRATRAFARFVASVERTIVGRPRAVAGAAAAIVATAALLATRVGTEYYSFDDLRPEGRIWKTIAYAEKIHGGLVPLAVFIEPPPGDGGEDAPDEAMLDPRAIALMDRIAAFLEARFSEVRAAASAADYWRKTFRLFAPEAAAAAPRGLPETRAAAGQLLAVFDDPRLSRDFLSHDRRTAAVYAMMPNLPSSRLREIAAEVRAYLADEERATGYRLRLTALFGMIDEIYHLLVGGLAVSFGLAICVSFAVFCVVLRSWRLGLVALVPNLLPIALTFAFMGLAGISLKPATVVIFSITLTIADDDTIQFLARFRAAFDRLAAAGAPDPHRAAALTTLRETGLPMFVTAASVTIGFLTLLFSQFVGLANLGLLIGVSLFTAVFADLFLTPLLLMHLRPRIGSPRGSS